MELLSALHGQPRLQRDTPLEPQTLAKLYDYVMHEEEPQPRAGRPDGGALVAGRGTPSRRIATPPPCVALQRRWRRDIEAHSHFDEIYQLWESDNQKGNGYPAWPRAPLLAETGGVSSSRLRVRPSRRVI